MDAQSESKPPSVRLFWLVWLTAVALVAGSFFTFLWFGPSATQAKVFRQTAHGWEAAPPLGSSGYNLRVSSSGVVWVQTAKGLSRLEGTSWHGFHASDFGTEYDDLPGQFALDGDDVWGAATDGVIHFDGQHWQCYPDAVATEHATSIAAAKGQVWVIDRDGDLSHFDGKKWTVRKPDLPGMTWSARTGLSPKLAVTGNGTLWLVHQGLWRSDGDSWTHIPGVGGEASLLGATSAGSYLYDGKTVVTHGEVWVADGHEVAGFDIDGRQFTRYKPQDLGLLDSSYVSGVAGRAPLIAFATSQGPLYYDGSRWHTDQPKRLGVYVATGVAIAPDGSLWGIGYPSTHSASIPFRALALANVVLTLFALGYPIWWWSLRSRRQRQAMREALGHSTGALPEELQGAEPAWPKSLAGGVGMVLLAGFIYGVARHYWPATPTWVLPVFYLATHSIATVAGSLKKRKPKPYDPIHPGGPPRYDWAKSLPAILGGLAVAVLMYGGSIARHFHIGWLAAIPGTALLLGGGVLISGYDMFRGQRVEREIKRGRYFRALEMLDGPLGWPPTGLPKLVRADVLYFSGRAREAELILQNMVETKSDKGHKTLAFEHLGRVLMAQNRYEDARRAFEAAANLMPGRSAAFSGLAELRLIQNVAPVQALEDAERALRLHRDSLLERKTAKERLSTIRGNQAWALARLGRGAEAQEAIDAGARDMDLKYIPEVAGFHWRAGMAMLAIENAAAAAGHFRRAMELDSPGYYGKLAAQHLGQLREQSVWGAVGTSR